MVAVDYSNKESIKNALTGVDVVICTISGTALNLQAGIAAAAKEAGVKLFVPSEFGNISEGETEGMFGEKADIQSQLKAVDIPCTVFYTGPFADYLWAPYVFFAPHPPGCACSSSKILRVQVLGPRCHEWESDHCWGWQQADLVHF